jgi:hypothetical protein
MMYSTVFECTYLDEFFLGRDTEGGPVAQEDVSNKMAAQSWGKYVVYHREKQAS